MASERCYKGMLVTAKRCIISVVENEKGTARELPSPKARISYVGTVALVFAVSAALVWPTIQKPLEKTLGLGADNLSRFWVAMFAAATSSVICFLVYFVAKRPLWDLLELLIVPLALATIGFLFTAQQDARQQQIEDRRDERARVIEEQRAKNAALQAYLDQMSHLMLEKNLLGSAEGDVVFTLAQARTSTAIRRLDGEHNLAVARFLSDSGLLSETGLLAKADLQDAELPKAELQDANLAGTELNGANLADAVLISADFSAEEKVGEDIVAIMADLTRADLSNAALQEADLALCTLDGATLTDAALQSADLSSASLKEADLSYAALQSADLSAVALPGSPPGLPPPPKMPTNLTGADLSHAVLQSADLSSADLTDADLTDAVLRDTTLSGALLGGADLSGADLTNATVTQEQLDKAKQLEGATMPNGQKYEEWLKDKESRGEDGENPGTSS
jgi:uncharacterized protein YjbI with pentapeptide repeats